MKLSDFFRTSGAAIMTVSGASAADLPVAEPVEYMRICDAFGTGFFYLPGTDTCLKIGGYARYEMHWMSEEQTAIDPDDDDPAFNNLTTRARAEVQFDARTMTNVGLLRSFISLRGTIGPTDFGSYSDSFNVDKAWLSLDTDMGTLTAGHRNSFFDFWSANAMNVRIGGDEVTSSTRATNLLAYTFALGNGFSATLSAEDKWVHRYGVLYTGSTITSSIEGSEVFFGHTTTDITANEGQEVPDFAGNIRVDQDWGAAQVMGVVGRVGLASGGFNDDEWGWAIGAGLSADLPGTVFSFDMQTTMAKGLIAYSTTGNNAPIFDAALNGAGGISLSESWAIQAGLVADVSTLVSVGIDGSYASVDHQGIVSTEDYDTWTVTGYAHWKPVSGLTISGEVAYEAIDPDNGAVLLEDNDVWGAMMRINRSF